MAEKEAALNELHVQDTVITGLQNDLETVRTQVKTLEGKLVIYTGLNNGLKADKEALQKQLELVTLRLPAPRVGFWARLFGKKNRNCQVTFHHSHRRMTPAADAGPFKN
ncbi:MAG: hypothetical protein ACXV5N_13145 [Halobacteriota archaeon]